MNFAGDQTSDSVWTIYAFGGGMGHLTRALSLARQAVHDGTRVRILCNSVFLPYFQAAHVRRTISLDPLIEIVAFPESLDREQVIEQTLQQIQRCRSHDVLIVDTFPRGIVGELASLLSSLSAYKVFLHRDVTPEYVLNDAIEASLSTYDLIILPGEDAPLARLAHLRTNVWTVCDSHELWTRNKARSLFGIDDGDLRPLIVVSATGTPEEAIEAARLAGQLKDELSGQSIVRLASLHLESVSQSTAITASPWPLLALLQGVDLLIGAGGYHTVYEARMTRTPLIGIPQQRLYDRQARRLKLSERVTSFDELVSRAVLQTAKDCYESDSLQVEFANGAAEACERIRQRVA